MHTDDRTKHEYKFCSFTVLVTQNTPINDTLLNQNTNFVKSTIRTCLESSHVLTILQSLYNYLLQPVVTIKIECLWKQYRDSEQTETKIWHSLEIYPCILSTICNKNWKVSFFFLTDVSNSIENTACELHYYRFRLSINSRVQNKPHCKG